MSKNIKIFALILLASLLLLSTLNCASLAVKAQSNATVVVLDAIGGTVEPSGTNTYADGTVVTFTATSTDPTFVFVNWIVVADDVSSTINTNPGTLTVSGGVSYVVQAVFQPTVPVEENPKPNLTTDAIVVVLASGGGTTTPAPGRYALANAASLKLTATPDSGWQFSHWVISGASTNHGGAPVDLTPTDNPYSVQHGYGYTYNYQAVFTPVGSTEPTPAPTATSTSTGTMGGLSTDTWIIIGLIVVIIVLLAAVGVLASKRKK
jgi:hypothetical protein